MKNLVAKSLIAAALIGTCYTTPSAARPHLSGMSCGAANALIQDRGSVVMNIKPHVFHRFVAKPNMCGNGKIAYTLSAKVGGAQQCSLNYACQDDGRGGGSSENSKGGSSENSNQSGNTGDDDSPTNDTPNSPVD